jgi:hypothetical protein
MDFASNTLADRYSPRSALARCYEPPAGLQYINAKVEEADDVSEPGPRALELRSTDSMMLQFALECGGGCLSMADPTSTCIL